MNDLLPMNAATKFISVSGRSLFVGLALITMTGQSMAFDMDFGLDNSILPHMHREYQPVKPEDELLTKSCEELEEAISYLIPATYQYKPDFNEDGYNAAAFWGSSVSEFGIGDLAWMYLPYSWFQTYLEEGRQHDTFYTIEKLRRAKAIKECYVN